MSRCASVCGNPPCANSVPSGRNTAFGRPAQKRMNARASATRSPSAGSFRASAAFSSPQYSAGSIVTRNRCAASSNWRSVSWFPNTTHTRSGWAIRMPKRKRSVSWS